jgi:hypothetical protein
MAREPVAECWPVQKEHERPVYPVVEGRHQVSVAVSGSAYPLQIHCFPVKPFVAVDSVHVLKGDWATAVPPSMSGAGLVSARMQRVPVSQVVGAVSKDHVARVTPWDGVGWVRRRRRSRGSGARASARPRTLPRPPALPRPPVCRRGAI